jgi:hypothetical protein
MQTNKLLALLVAAVLALAAAGCSSSSKDEENVSSGTTERASAPEEEATGTTPAEDEEGSSSDGGSSDDGSSEGGDTDLIPGEGRFEDCLEVGMTYAGIYLSALGLATEEDRKQLEQTVEDIKGKVPEDIKDDLQVVADGIAEADGLTGISEFFETDEYKQADENIQRYLEETCGASSG